MSLYLGLDSSTQGLKALLIDTAAGKIVANAAVHFGKDLPRYGCPDGFLPHADPLVVHAPPRMWAEALDLVLQRLQATGAPLGQVRALSGSGQQHGSVYMAAGYEAKLAALDPALPLADQLDGLFSRPTSPIWMDSSTSQACREITEAVGERLQRDTGSPAIERFTGPQIRKFYREAPAAYEATARVHLVSSFMASLMIGGEAAIDYGDGAGMNLLNLHTLQWDAAICEATAPGLLAKLPPVRPSSERAGALHAYFTKFGLPAGIPVMLWSGDNPNSLVGVGAGEPGTAVISLGTSDVFFAAMAGMRTDPGGCGHVFGNPAGGFMSLTCFKNGSLARERVKEECGVDWTYFDQTAFAETKPGNDGNMMLPYFIPEITPLVLEAGVRLRGTPDFEAGKASSAVKIRALVESQMLSMRLHARWIGEDFKTIRVTGGASRSRGLVQVLADVFQAHVETIAVPDSAALGAALRAAQAECGMPWRELYAAFCAATATVAPNPATREVYARALGAYEAFSAS